MALQPKHVESFQKLTRNPKSTQRSTVSTGKMNRALTYRRSGVGLAQADGLGLDTGFVLLKEGRRGRQGARGLVAPVLPERPRASVQTHSRQLHEHRVTQLQAYHQHRAGHYI